MPSDPTWRQEKARNVVRATCHVLLQLRRDAAISAEAKQDLASAFHPILWDATKLYCDASAELIATAVESPWSPELPEYLFEHPEKCDESLRIVADPDYRDPYYDA